MKRNHWDKIEPKSNYKLPLDKNENIFSNPMLNEILKTISIDKLQLYPDLNKAYKNISKILNIDPYNILLTNGADDALSILFTRLAQSYHIVPVIAFLDPTYAMVKVHATNNNWIQKKIPYTFNNNKFVYDESILFESQIDVVYLANPDNPTGIVHDHNLINRLLSAGKIVILDQAYNTFTTKTNTFNIIENENPNLYIVKTFSKELGAGAKIGCIISSYQNISHLSQYKLSYEISNIGAHIIDILANSHIKNTVCKDIIRCRKKFNALLRKYNIKCYTTETNFVLFDQGDHEIHKFIDTYCYTKKIIIANKELIKMSVPPPVFLHNLELFIKFSEN